MLIRLLAAGLCLGLLAGCGSGDGEDDGGQESARPDLSASGSPGDSAGDAAGPAPYLEVPEGVSLTEPGTALELGEEGVIAFERRQQEIGALAVTVERIERTTFARSFPGWSVDEATAARTPYFVRLSVTNVGDTDLGGMRLDNVLWGDDGATLEAPNYYAAGQLPVCAGVPLPKSFPTGTSAELCQVYFIAPARELQSVTFRPPADRDAITWSGELSKVRKPSGRPSQDAS